MLEGLINSYLENSFIEEAEGPWPSSLSVSIMRDDLIDAEISGNKLRKLKYNLLEAEKQGNRQLLTFGGAYSNHIAATAAAGKRFDFKTTGLIRGEELDAGSNPTLVRARENGMELHFISREEYRLRNGEHFLEKMRETFPDHYVIPEGGANWLGIKGCMEIMSARAVEFDYVLVPCGTGTTLAGIILGAQAQQHIIGFSALREKFLEKQVQEYIGETVQKPPSWEISSSFHFGGYARVTQPLIDFLCMLSQRYGIFAEPIYTGKMFYGLAELARQGYFPRNAKILAIHTGGLQGWQGFNLPGRPLINL